MSSYVQIDWTSLLKSACVWALVFGIFPTQTKGQDVKQEQVEALNLRLERLEHQNQLLLKMLESRNQQTPQSTSFSSVGTTTTSPEERLLEGIVLSEKDSKQNSSPIREVTSGSLLNMNGSWKNGLWFESSDKAFRVHVGGRAQTDLVFLSANDHLQFAPGGIGKVDDAVAFRRGRLAVEGTFWEITQFNVEFDFVNTFNAERSAVPLVANTPVPTDFWIQFDKLP